MALKMCTWKDRPCHFTWNITAGDFINYEKIVRNLDYDLKVTRNLLSVEKLLFRAYLEVSHRRYYWDVRKAREYLDKADDYIQNHTNPDLKTGYKSVALLNRLWIEHKTLNKMKVSSLLAELNGLNLEEKDLHVVGAVKAAALTRFGPREVSTAIELFEAVLQHFPNSPDFLFGAALMTGRKMRFYRRRGALYKDLDKDGKELMDKEKAYCQRLIKVNDEYQLGRSYLGLNLSRRDHGLVISVNARFHLEKAYKRAPSVKAVFNNLIRYYRFHDIEKAVSALKHNIQQWPYLDVAESHFQLALCYIRKSKNRTFNGNQTKIFRGEALEELDECLKLEEMHIFAFLEKVKLLTKAGDKEEAQRLYEDKLQQSEYMTNDDVFHLYFNFAQFLDVTKSPSRIDTWQHVMDTAHKFQYQDEKSGTWEVTDKIKADKDKAYKTLAKHYQHLENAGLPLGILYFQNFEFAKAEEALIKLDPKTDVKIPMYLAETYLKWGREIEVRARFKQCKPEEATEWFRKARANVVKASKISSFDETHGRMLMGDIALFTAHNQLIIKESSNQGYEVCQAQSVKASLQPHSYLSLEDQCIESYREAVKCGSLVASLELLRLIQKGHIKETSRSKYLQILAEMDVCCSRSDCLHMDSKPLSFEKGPNSRDTDGNLLDMDCDMIKKDIEDILNQNEFYMDARKEHFNMERKILQEEFKNKSLLLMLAEDGENGQRSDTIVKAAVDCCEKARPLLDHIVVKFQKEELNISEEKTKQYFPLKSEQDPVKLEKELQKALRSTFEIDMITHYPKLFKYLLKIQPGYNRQNEILNQLSSLVNTAKHSSRNPTELQVVVKDPVNLARQCTDKVEEICNVFFDVMAEASDLLKKKDELLIKIRGGMHEQADLLFNMLSNNEDFVVRMGSTWKFLQMLAEVVWSREKSGSYGDPAAESKMAEGKCALIKELRKSHLAVEVSILKTGDRSSNDVLEKCRDTCKEADKLLKTVIENKKEESQDGTIVKFPFRDMHPGQDTLQKLGSSHWKGKVKKQIKKDLKEMRIPLNDKFLESMLQVQPCSNVDNYHFIAMRAFLNECASADSIPVTVIIETDNQVRQEYQVVDVTQWCTDHAEKTAAEIAEQISD